MPKPIRPKYQVFISSTFRDLREAREKVTWEVLKAGHIPVGMENFSATDDRGWEIIRKLIDLSDYYVLIVGGLYGSTDAETGKSWTEKEYEYAREKGVPVLAFLRDLTGLAHELIESDASKRSLVEAFRTRIKDSHLVESWNDPERLPGQVGLALIKIINEDEDSDTPRPGWIRGDQAGDPNVGSQLAALVEENRQLRARLEADVGVERRRTLGLLRAIPRGERVYVNDDDKTEYHLLAIYEDENALDLRRGCAAHGPHDTFSIDQVERVWKSERGWEIHVGPRQRDLVRKNF